MRRRGPATCAPGVVALGALAAALVGGCGEPPAGGGDGAADPPAEPTFARDVAPIVYSRCAGCHRPEGPGPFDLLTYDDVADRAQQIAEVTASRFMPPWLPEPGGVELLGDRRLADSEIATIQRWVETGARRGDPDLLPPPPQPPDGDGWQLGPPDQTVAMPEPYLLSAEGRDVFRNFVMPIAVDRTHWVRTVELRADNPQVIHHATLWIDRTHTSRRIDEETDEPGYPSMDPRTSAEDPDGHFLGWTPGTVPFAGHPETAWRLDPGTDFVLQLHMLPTGKPEPLRVEVGLHFADAPPARTPSIVWLGTKTLDIPPGEPRHVVEDSYVLPVAVEALSVRPHAHYLAVEMRLRAVPPDGDPIDVLELAWDFNWQEEYHFREPLELPAGTRLETRFVYDNTAANPLNPHQPPQRVHYGPHSVDEMGDLWLQVLTEGPGERAVLEREMGAEERRAEIAGYRARLEREPERVDLHVDLARRLEVDGDVVAAERHYRRALRLRPDLATAHANLGALLAGRGDLDPAAAASRRALELDSTFYEAEYNLGNIALARGDLDAAERHFRRGLEINPGNPVAQGNLGSVLLHRGELAAAVERFERALAMRPDDAHATYNLGLARARMGDLDAAAEAFRRAADLAPGLAEPLVALGNVALRRGRLREAEERFRGALGIDPGHAGARQGLATLRRAGGGS